MTVSASATGNASAAERRERLWQLLGPLPPRGGFVEATCTLQREQDGYVLERLELRLDASTVEAVPAYFAKPSEGPGVYPTLLYHHAHGGEYQMGKEELVASRSGMQPTPYAVELTRRGFAVLCIDAINFGERHHRTESSLFKEMLWKGEVLWGRMMWEAARALDYLSTRPDVYPDRIATMGMSMGSTTAWWLAALDERVKVCVDLCCLTDFEALIRDGGLDRHGLYYYVPGLLKEFSAAGINGLIAPRAHLALTGRGDPLTPSPGLEKIDSELAAVYAATGAAKSWQLQVFDCAHEETPEMRAAALQWLEKLL